MATPQRKGSHNQQIDNAPERSGRVVEEDESREPSLAAGSTTGRKTRRFIVVEDYEEDIQECPQNMDCHSDTASLEPSENVKPSDFKCGTPYMHSLPKDEGYDYWADLLKPLQDSDAAQRKIWEGEVQNILIFASLFSAVVTSFVIESYKNLKPGPNDEAVILLARIVARLDNPVNGSVSPLIPNEALPFHPSLITVNAFWILSLIASLTTVLIGIVASQWLREHQQLPDHFSVEEKFGLLSMRVDMTKKWHLPAFFAALPVLLELAFVLFFLGLAEFLRSLGILQVTIPSILAICLSLMFLLATTTIPALQLLTVQSRWTQVNENVPVPCPYKSPQARLFRLFISSTLGDIFARYIFIPAYAIVIQSVRGITSLHMPSWFMSLAFVLLRPSHKQYFWKSIRSGQTHFWYLWKFIRGHWRRNPANVHPPSYPRFNPVSSHSWTGLDMEWVFLRRNYSSGLSVASWYRCRFEKRLEYGPLYDHILGIQHLCSRFEQDRTILESAYHCFVDCISSTNMEPGQPSLDYSLQWYGEDYYNALVKMLRPVGTVLIEDIVPQPPSPELMYDQALLLFLERFVLTPDLRSMRRELIHRMLNYFLENDPSEQVDIQVPLPGLAYWQADADNIFRECLKHPNEDEQKTVKEYLFTFFENIPKGTIDWTLHRICGQFFCLTVATYIGTNEAEAVESAAAWLNVKLHPGPQPSADDEHTTVHAFLSAFAVVEGYMDNNVGYQPSVPPVVQDLAATLKDRAVDIISHPDDPSNKSILAIISELWDRDEEYILTILRSYIHGRQGDFRSLYRLDNASEGGGSTSTSYASHVTNKSRDALADASSDEPTHLTFTLSSFPSCSMPPLPPDPGIATSLDKATHEMDQNDESGDMEAPPQPGDTVGDEYTRAEAGVAQSRLGPDSDNA